MFKGRTIRLAVCAVAVAAFALAGCGGSGGGTAGNAGGGGTTGDTGTQSGVTLNDVCYMWDQELIPALENDGFKVKEEDSDSVTYAKDDIEVLISETGGYRIYAFVGDEVPDIYDFIVANVPDVSNAGQYSNGSDSYVVATGTVAHDDGVVVGSEFAVFIVESGNFQQLQGFASSANVTSGMSAQAAAANVVLVLNDNGYNLKRGDGIDLGFAEATTNASNYAEEDVQVGGSSNGGAQSDLGKSIYKGTWYDPDYGDTMTFNSDGTLTIKQTNEGTTTWWWSETSNGITIENAGHSYQLTLAQQNGTYILYNDSKGLLFEK